MEINAEHQGDIYRSRPAFIRGGFGRVSTSSQKSGPTSLPTPPSESYNYVEEVTKIEDGKRVKESKYYTSRRHSTTQTVESSFTVFAYGQGTIEIEEKENSAICSQPKSAKMLGIKNGHGDEKDCFPRYRISKPPTNGNKTPHSPVLDPNYYSSGTYHTIHIHPREKGDPIHTPNLASYQAGIRAPYRSATPVAFVQSSTPVLRRSTSPNLLRGQSSSPAHTPLEDRRRMIMGQPSSMDTSRCRSLPPITSSKSADSATSPYTSRYNVTGRVYSLKTGDIKLLMKSDSKEETSGSDLWKRSDEKSISKPDARSKFFEHKSSKTESNLSEYGKPEKNSIIPTSSQLVRDVEETFKSMETTHDRNEREKEIQIEIETQDKMNDNEKSKKDREMEEKEAVLNFSTEDSFDGKEKEETKHQTSGKKYRESSRSPYSDAEVSSAIATLKSVGTPSPSVKPRSRFSLARLSRKKDKSNDEQKPTHKWTPDDIESWMNSPSPVPAPRTYSMIGPLPHGTCPGITKVQPVEDLSHERSQSPTPQYSHQIVVAIDFGTTYSGYAYSFTHDPEHVNIMRKWEGDDPGMNNQKIPTMLLLTPDEKFHSFGFTARDTYNELDSTDRHRWFFFERYKMNLHHDKEICRDSMIRAANGKLLRAMTVFSLTLEYFRKHALIELSDAVGSHVRDDDIRWVVTVPAIWRQKSKQFMREAAYQAGIGSSDNPSQVLIALEPEAASIYCRKLRRNQIVPEKPRAFYFQSHKNPETISMCSDFVLEDVSDGGRYMVVDCGGGTVDITVHELSNQDGHLKELFKATGGPFGAIMVNEAFKTLLDEIFGREVMDEYREKRPAGYVDLMNAFEARKRGCAPHKITPLNIALPFSFIDFYKKMKRKDVGTAINKFCNRDITWQKHGMIRLDVSVMKQLFQITIAKIIEQIRHALDSPNFSDAVEEHGITHLFLVGGFSESSILQEAIREEFRDIIKVIIPQGTSVAVLKGAVLYGLDPSIVHVRRAMKTYGIGVIKPFVFGTHPEENLVVKDNQAWCMDVFDKFVVAGQSVSLGEAVVRQYRPVSSENHLILLHIFSSDEEDKEFITDSGVELCGTLSLSLEALPKGDKRRNEPREIQAKMLFGDTEIKASALDVLTQQTVKAYINFLNESNPKYITKL